MSAGNAAAQRSSFANEMLLADEFVQIAWTHSRREWLPLWRWLEEGFGASPKGSLGGWHDRMVAPRRAATRGGMPRA